MRDYAARRRLDRALDALAQRHSLSRAEISAEIARLRRVNPEQPYAARKATAIADLVRRRTQPQPQVQGSSWPFMERLVAQREAENARRAANRARRREELRELIKRSGLTRVQVEAAKQRMRQLYTFGNDLNYTELAVRELARGR